MSSSPFVGGLPRPFGNPVTIAAQGTSARRAAVATDSNLDGRKGVCITNAGSTELEVYLETGLTNQVTVIPASKILLLVASDGEDYFIATDSGTTKVVMYEYKAG